MPAVAKHSGGIGYADKGSPIAQGSGSRCGRVRPPPAAGCHLNFAQVMPFQPCADRHFAARAQFRSPVIGITIYRVANGKIVERWSQEDRVSLLLELGGLS